MADAIIARQQGDDFQARWFWLYAANLLRETSHIQRVSFETGPKAFDDVVVEYAAENAPVDHQGHPYLRDHMQCKWHVRPGQFSHQDLTDPKFSNAQSVSHLDNALLASRIAHMHYRRQYRRAPRAPFDARFLIPRLLQSRGRECSGGELREPGSPTRTTD